MADTTTTSNVDESCLVNEKKCSVIHLLPCNIHHDGPAPVKNYFQTQHLDKGQSSNNKYSVANFRGRRIEGLTVSLPPSTVGCVVHTNRSDNSLEVHSTFNSFTVWDHDNAPSEEVIGKSMEYFDIANIVSKFIYNVLMKCCCYMTH